MNAYAKGRAFEQALVRTLRANGIWAIRSAGSKGPADIVAWSGGRRALIQAKVGGGASKSELNRLSHAARDMGATAWLVVRNSGISATLIWPELPTGFTSGLEVLVLWLKGDSLPV